MCIDRCLPSRSAIGVQYGRETGSFIHPFIHSFISGSEAHKKKNDKDKRQTAKHRIMGKV